MLPWAAPSTSAASSSRIAAAPGGPGVRARAASTAARHDGTSSAARSLSAVDGRSAVAPVDGRFVPAVDGRAVDCRAVEGGASSLFRAVAGRSAARDAAYMAGGTGCNPEKSMLIAPADAAGLGCLSTKREMKLMPTQLEGGMHLNFALELSCGNA